MATISKPSRPFFYFEDLHIGEATTVREEAECSETNVSTELTLCGGNKKNTSSNFLNLKKTASVNTLECKEDGPATKLVLYDESWWHVRKVLTDSDVGLMMRLILTTKLVQDHILPTMTPGQIQKINSSGLDVKVLDIVEGTEHDLVFKKWKKPSSYVFVSGWKKQFVEEKNLKIHDVVGFIWNAQNTKFYFRVMSRS